MQRSIVIYGPQGCGKTRNAEALRIAFGLDRVFESDEFPLTPPPRLGALILTNDESAALITSESGFARVLSFPEAMREAGIVGANSIGYSAHRFEAGGFMAEDSPVTWPERFEVATKLDSAMAAMAAPVTAPDILDAARLHLMDRAALRDQPQGERSMGRTVAAFNAITGHALSERDGWLFMVTLKAVRAATTPNGIADDYQDGTAYFSLAGEAAARATE